MMLLQNFRDAPARRAVKHSREQGERQLSGNMQDAEPLDPAADQDRPGERLLDDDLQAGKRRGEPVRRDPAKVISARQKNDFGGLGQNRVRTIALGSGVFGPAMHGARRDKPESSTGVPPSSYAVARLTGP